MEATFYIAAGVAILSTVMVITSYNMIHALIYLIVSFLAIAIVFFVLGAPFIAALEIIIYAGAIVVLVIFVIMMLNLRDETVVQEKSWLTREIFIFPAILSTIRRSLTALQSRQCRRLPRDQLTVQEKQPL